MKRLTGLDACFAHFDTPTAPLGVALVCTFDQATAPEPYSFERVRATVQERLHLVPPMRRRLVEGPVWDDRPHWIEDPSFDLDAHLHRVLLPGPAGEQELATLTGEVVARPFDRDRPLWDMAIIEGFEQQNSASITRLHHAAIDGVSGAEALANFLDLDPRAGPPTPPEDVWQPEVSPSIARLVADTVRSAVRLPGDTAVRMRRVGTAGLRMLLQRYDGANSAATRSPLPFTAPRTPLNGSLTQRRSVAFARVELGDLDRIRRPAKASINDVLLAICARSLRGYLRRRNSLPSKPLVGAMPISVHSDDDNSEAVNQVSGALVELATDVDHPQECLQRTMTAAAAAKATHHALGPTMVADLAELAPAPLLRGMARLDQSAGASRRLPPVANVVISNFAGPPIPLYFAGARLQAAYPLGPLAFGAGLNITAQSYLDALHIGINACPDLIDDVTEIATGLTDAINDLLQLTARTQTRAS